MSSLEEFGVLLGKIKSLAQNEYSGDMFFDTLGELLVRESVCPSHDEVQPLLEELFRFLYLSVKCDNISPPDMIDAAWKVLLQLPLFYAKICAELQHVPLDNEKFSVIERNPFFADNSYAHERRCQKYVAEYQTYFGDSPPKFIHNTVHKTLERQTHILNSSDSSAPEDFTTFRNFAATCGHTTTGDFFEVLGEVLMRDKLCCTAEHADIIMEELLRFLFLKSRQPDVLPSDIVCQAWWKLLLLPQYYVQLCRYLREGKPSQHQIIDYNPLSMDNKYAVERRRESYNKCYEETFGAPPPEVRKGERRSASSLTDGVESDDADIAPSKTMKTHRGLRVVAKSVPAGRIPAEKPVRPVSNETPLKDTVQQKPPSASPSPHPPVSTPAASPVTNGQASPGNKTISPLPQPGRPLGPSEKLVIFVQEEGKTSKLSFKLLATTSMKAVIDNYSAKMKIPVGSLRFTANGRIVTEQDTALSLGLENSGVITATILNVTDVN